MLTDLHVRDLGVIEDLALEFGPGMTALTGETGAGKTLVVEALQLVLGGRAHPGMVRAGAAEALVEARFVVGQGDTEREVILARSVPAEGGRGPGSTAAWPRSARWARRRRSWSRSTGSTSTAPSSTAAAQRDVLDAFAGTDLSRVRALRSQLRALDDALAALGGDQQQRAREADVLRYQVDEIAAAHLEDPEEEAALRLRGGPPGRRRRPTASAAPGRGGADSIPPATTAEPSTCWVAPRPRCPGREAFDGYRERAWPRRRSNCPTWRAPCATRSRAGRTTPPAWPRSRSAGGCWPSSGASTARTCGP